MKYSKGVPCPQRKRKNVPTGENNPNWKGGSFHSSNGYVWVLSPKHPFASKVSPVGYILEHRLVMEKKLGRYLTKKEVVHHVNGVRDDNRIENLVLTTHGHHIATHNHERVWSEQSKNKSRINAKNRKRDKFGKLLSLAEHK